MVKPKVPFGGHFVKSGGEGGIRTLGTGISQYNGLANLWFDAVPIGFNGLQSDYLTLVGPDRSHAAILVLHFVLHFRSLPRQRPERQGRDGAETRRLPVLDVAQGMEL